MTQFRVLGSPNKPNQPKETIFTDLIASDGSVTKPGIQPRGWNTITLLHRLSHTTGVFLAEGPRPKAAYIGIIGDEFSQEECKIVPEETA